MKLRKENTPTRRLAWTKASYAEICTDLNLFLHVHICEWDETFQYLKEITWILPLNLA